LYLQIFDFTLDFVFRNPAKFDVCWCHSKLSFV